MADIVIRRCSLHVVRRGGWSWATDRGRLIETFVQLLPELIGTRIAEHWSDRSEAYVREPIRITVPLPNPGVQLTPRALRDSLAREIEDPLAAALEKVTAVTIRGTTADSETAASPGEQGSSSGAEEARSRSTEPSEVTPPANHLGALLALLIKWRAQDLLGAVLDRLPEPALTAWRDVLLGAATGVRPTSEAPAGMPAGFGDPVDVASIIEERVDLSSWTGSRAATLRLWIQVIVEVAARAGARPLPTELETMLARRLPLDPRFTRARPPNTARQAGVEDELEGAAEEAHVQDDGHTTGTPLVAQSPAANESVERSEAADDAGMQDPPGSTSAIAGVAGSGDDPPTRDGPRAARRATGTPPTTDVPGEIPVAARPRAERLRNADLRVSSALPFLMLGPLSRIGYLDTLEAAVGDGANLRGELPLFAAGLAFKTLDPVDRGWRRTPEARWTAAAFAGLTSVPEPALAGFVRKVTDFLPALDEALARALTDGHAPDQPLVLSGRPEAEDGASLLVDAQGLFPIRWIDDAEMLVDVLRHCGSPLLLVDADARRRDWLRSLDAAGIEFLAEGPAGRGEPWQERALRGDRRFCTNRRKTQGLTPGNAGQLTDLKSRIDALISELISRRPAVPLAQSPDLDRSLFLAASTALGTLAWTLWRSRESVDPLLALARFRDLDARVRFEPHVVRIHVPLGRRRQDLFDNGLLQDIDHVPWLDGRRVEFA